MLCECLIIRPPAGLDGENYAMKDSTKILLQELLKYRCHHVWVVAMDSTSKCTQNNVCAVVTGHDGQSSVNAIAHVGLENLSPFLIFFLWARIFLGELTMREGIGRWDGNKGDIFWIIEQWRLN